MDPKKQAELQRKLTLTVIPRPPAGLSERLKRDIPAQLVLSTERDRFSHSLASNLRVAASILLLIASAYLCVQLISRAPTSEKQAAMQSVKSSRQTVETTTTLTTFGYVTPGNPTAPSIANPTTQPTDAPAVSSSNPQVLSYEDKTKVPVAAPSLSQTFRRAPESTRPEVTASPAAPSLIPEPMQQTEVSATHEVQNQIAESAASGVAVGSLDVAAAPARKTISGAPAYDLQDYAKPASAAAPAPPPAPAVALAPMIAPSADSRSLEKKDARDSLIREARADELSLSKPTTVFGVSVDKHVFDRVKNAIERGQQPDAGTVNVEALVNYFAGAAPRAPRDVRLEIEGSPAPVPSAEQRLIVRVTVDTASADTHGGSNSPVASDARLDVAFDPRVVASHRRVGSNDLSMAAEPALLTNTSVTTLYEIVLQPHSHGRDRIATATLYFRDTATGKERTIGESLRRTNLAHSWSAASRRHRLASLGAVWGETLRGMAGGTDIARRAEELAKQEPKDRRARELADVATASSRLRNSAPTGSGR